MNCYNIAKDWVKKIGEHSVSTWKEISFQKEILAFGRKFGRK
jgi:hypothetical protein